MKAVLHLSPLCMLSSLCPGCSFSCLQILLVDVNADVHFLQVVEAVPMLPEIPLPAIQPNYRPLPSIDMLTPLSPQRRKGDALIVSYKQQTLSAHVLTQLIIKTITRSYPSLKSMQVPSIFNRPH